MSYVILLHCYMLHCYELQYPKLEVTAEVGEFPQSCVKMKDHGNKGGIFRHSQSWGRIKKKKSQLRRVWHGYWDKIVEEDQSFEGRLSVRKSSQTLSIPPVRRNTRTRNRKAHWTSSWRRRCSQEQLFASQPLCDLLSAPTSFLACPHVDTMGWAAVIYAIIANAQLHHRAPCPAGAALI